MQIDTAQAVAAAAQLVQIDTAAVVRQATETLRISGLPWTQIFVFLAGAGAAIGTIYLVTRKTYQEAIQNLPSQQNVAVYAASLVASTALIYFVTIFLKIKLDENWEKWLWFVGGIFTGNIAYFGVKRKTTHEPPKSVSEVRTGEPAAAPTGQYPVTTEQPAAAEPMMATGEDGDLPRGRPK